MTNKLDELRTRGVVRDEIHSFSSLVYAEGMRQVHPDRVFIDVGANGETGPFLHASVADAERLEDAGYRRADIAPLEPDLLSIVQRFVGMVPQYTALLLAAEPALDHFKGRQALDVGEYAFEIAGNFRLSIESLNADVVRRVRQRGDSRTADAADVLIVHRPASALIQAIATGLHPQHKRKHRASDKQLFYAMGMMLLALGLERPLGDAQRELLILDAAECVYGLQHLKSLGLGGTRTKWSDALKAAWPDIKKKYGADISADQLRRVLAHMHDGISLPVSRRFDNVVSELPGRSAHKVAA